MNKAIKYSVIGVSVLVIIFLLIYFKMFVIGNSSYKDITINKVSVGSNITIDGVFTNSGLSFKDYDYTLVGKELYVEVKSVLVSKKYDKGSFSIVIPLNEEEVNDIHLTDGKSTKVIYKNGL